MHLKIQIHWAKLQSRTEGIKISGPVEKQSDRILAHERDPRFKWPSRDTLRLLFNRHISRETPRGILQLLRSRVTNLPSTVRLPGDSEESEGEGKRTNDRYFLNEIPSAPGANKTRREKLSLSPFHADVFPRTAAIELSIYF